MSNFLSKKTLTFFLTVFVAFQCVGQTLENDRLALISLYNATNGSQWSNNTGWIVPGTAGDNPCGWYGVTCSAGRVTEISFVENGLEGTLPSELGNLDMLELLRFNTEKISGTIPATLGNLKQLKMLVLIATELSGTIPAQLGEMTSVEQLILTTNDLSGTIPPELGNLSNLFFLSISNSKVSGAVPASFSNLLKLKTLVLQNNQLSGVIPAFLNTLPELSFMLLNKNQLVGPVPDLGNFLNPEVANISENLLNFSGLEGNNSNVVTHPQKALQLVVTGNQMSVAAGGNIANNTYTWYRNSFPIAINQGNNTYTFTDLGSYRVEISNILVPGLILTSNFHEVGSLPVTLLHFKAQPLNEGNLLEWSTTEEVNNLGFEVERSRNAKDFVSIARLDGHGNSRIKKNYKYVDPTPFAQTYYRLKQIDFDGTESYSRVIVTNRAESVFKAYPNPVDDYLKIETSNILNRLTIFDVLGQKIMDLTGSTTYNVSTESFKEGVYILKSGNDSQKIFKK